MRIIITTCLLLLVSQRLYGQAAAQFLTDDLNPVRVATVRSAFTEGPTPDRAGGIWFSDIPNTNIHRFDIATGTTTLVNDNSGGSNGLLFDDQGRLLAAEHFTQRVTRTDGDQVEVLADMWDGKQLNSPNDITADSQGGLYFTDPAYANDVQREGVYYISPDGELSQVISNLSRPNGIALSPDEQTLYVAEPTTNPGRIGNPKLWKYDILAPGTPQNPRVFSETFADGLTVDAFGNVFAATFFGYAAWTPNGEKIFQENTPSATTNLAFENPAGTYPNWLYITAGDSLYRTQMLPIPEPSVIGDYNANGMLDASDLDLQSAAIRGGQNPEDFDLTDDRLVDVNDLIRWVEDLKNTYFGDANLDGEFNSGDLVTVLGAGEFQDDIELNSGWATGDWTGDGEFNSADLVVALADGGFGKGPRVAAAAVPEPTSAALLCIIGLLAIARRRR